MAGQIEEVYGQAMFEAARERGKTEILKTEAEILEQVLELPLTTIILHCKSC